MPETRPAIEVKDLSKRYGDVAALRGVTFAVQTGEIFGLLGRNGAGKTTTLETVLGLRKPDTGSVAIHGIDALAQPERAKAMVGAQLQAATLQDKMTPYGALEFFGSFFRPSTAPAELLERFGLADKAHAPFDSLSGGQRQRLFIALAFVHRPEVVVFDEPTAGLDPQVRRDLHDLILRCRSDGITVLLSTHDLDEAGQLCDRIGIIHEGRMIAVDTPAALVARSQRPTILALRTARPLDQRAVAELPAVRGYRQRASEWLLETSDLTATIVAAVQHLGVAGNLILDLQVRRPTLEDVFIELTGSPWDNELPTGPDASGGGA